MLKDDGGQPDRLTDDPADADAPADGDDAADGDAPEKPADDPANDDPDADDPANVADAPAWQPAPPNTARLGGLKTDAAKLGYYTEVMLTSRGAAVESVTLNDGRYRELTDRDTQLKVIGNGGAIIRTFQTRIPALDAALRPYKMRPGVDKSRSWDSLNADWTLTETIPDPDDDKVDKGAVFTLAAPDGSFEAVKTYTLRKGTPDLSPKDHQRGGDRDTDPRGYLLDMDLTFRILKGGPRTFEYTVQGPVGVPLENEDNTRQIKNIELGYYEAPGEFETTYLSAADATAAVKKSKESLAADEDVRRLEEEARELAADYRVAEVKSEAAPDDAAQAARAAELETKLAAVERELTQREKDLAVGRGAGGVPQAAAVRRVRRCNISRRCCSPAPARPRPRRSWRTPRTPTACCPAWATCSPRRRSTGPSRRSLDDPDQRPAAI